MNWNPWKQHNDALNELAKAEARIAELQRDYDTLESWNRKNMTSNLNLYSAMMDIHEATRNVKNGTGKKVFRIADKALS